MKVQVDSKRFPEVLDRLLQMHRDGVYPFSRTDAVVPQTLIGEDIREDKRALSLFYFFACIYMRGGIVSSTAFKLLLKMRTAYPWMFEPAEVITRDVAAVRMVLKRHIGWDSENAGLYWHLNAGLLVEQWRGNPLNILGAIENYDDALTYYVNKNKKGSKKPGTFTEKLQHNQRSLGFWGHQHKMASMQVYFADWERLFTKRFLYPGPVDFHNYRLFLTTGAIKLVGVEDNESVSFGEKVSRPARDALMNYLIRTGVDPVDLADVIWLYSLLMCGESPHTKTKEAKKKPAPLFLHGEVEEVWSIGEWSKRKATSLHRSCHVCAFNRTCRYAIPAGPYYGKKESGERGGKIVLRPRPPLAFHLKPEQIDPRLVNAPLMGEAAEDYNVFEKKDRPVSVLTK